MPVGLKLQIDTFSKCHPKIQVYCSLASNDQKHAMCLWNKFSNLSIFGRNQFVTDMRSFEHTNHHLKIMHFSVKCNILHSPTNGISRDHPVCNLHLNL